VVADVVAEAAGRTGGLPLFADPVIHDPAVATSLRRLQRALAGGTALERDERLSAAVLALVRRGSTRPLIGGAARLTTSDAAGIAARVRALLDERYADDLPADYLAAAAGRSRFAAYRAFKAAYGLAPSEYQRQVRLRAARRLLARGDHLAQVAADVGFADQAHMTRWFVRSYGLTPGSYRQAVGAAGATGRSSWIGSSEWCTNESGTDRRRAGRYRL
jgi:AraC-like DNA-binding protein